MFGLSRYDRHANLVARMGRALGIDLVEETMRGNLAPEELRSTVQRCTGCSGVAACEAWLDANPEGATATPSFCRNDDLFNLLKHDR